ncbi:hypothetical protein [Pseudoxanthomonas sp. JBR18]|uniref:hypothetical protein n=1 Tax=Pseudoxanthomonas sp. JBR18 TaxID=2969308 RepID=UPI002305175F|nr:hypothetical protein [Pseudoxanthomonas sp. JBR18]WCE04395.1 hypothetical protein PJ250_20415 [Pseudoxanthomonas sp. JBR18]
MRPSHPALAFAHVVLGLMLLARGLRHLSDAHPALSTALASPSAFGYACGQALASTLMLAAGIALLWLGARRRPINPAG